MAEFSSFLRPNDSSLYGQTTFCLSVHPSVDTWVVFTFWLLWITLLWTWVYKHLLMSLLSILWGIYPEVELLNPTVIWCLGFWGTARLPSSVAALLCIHQGCIWSTPFRPILWEARYELKARIEGNILKWKGPGWRATRGLSENVGGTIRRCVRKQRSVAERQHTERLCSRASVCTCNHG